MQQSEKVTSSFGKTGVTAGRSWCRDPTRSVGRLGEELVKACIACGLTQEDLARRQGRYAKQVQKYERTFHDAASLATLKTVAAVFSKMSMDR